jgi:hypothetical protein
MTTPHDPHSHPSRRATYLLRAAIATWAVAAVAGLGALGAYAARPGVPGEPPPAWPRASRVLRVEGRPALLLFLDGRCPCAAASLSEFARILGRAPGRVDATVVASGPDVGLTAPGAETVADPRGEEAGRFGVVTSGHALLFDGRGRLAFSGGITPARGHEGGSLGASAIVAHLAGQPARAEAPVFGCPIGCPSPPEEVPR